MQSHFYRKFINFDRIYVRLTNGSYKVGPQPLVIPSDVAFLLIHLTNVFMKLSASSPSTTLMFTARVVRHANNAPLRLILALLCFTSIDPNSK